MPVERRDDGNLVFGYLDTASADLRGAFDTVLVRARVGDEGYAADMRPSRFGALSGCDISGEQEIRVMPRPSPAAPRSGHLLGLLVSGGGELEQDGRRVALTLWTSVLDVVRLGPEDDATAVTAAQLRAVAERLISAGQWAPGDPDITIVMDAGYDVTRLAWALQDLPVELVGRVRGDRVMRLPKPSRKEYALAYPQGGRPPKPGKEFRFAKPETWPEAAVTTVTDTANYGKAEARAWDRVHPRLTHRSAWLEHDGELSVLEGTLVRLKVEHLSKEREAPPVWLWSSKTGATPADVHLWWQVFLRRFDLEHTFRFTKQTLGWTTPKVRTPEDADRWTWLLVVDHTQLRLARPLAADLRRHWEKPARPERLTPARVPRGFRNISAHLRCPARVPQPRGTGPRRPPGTKNRHPAPRYDVGKTAKRPETLKAIGRPGRSW